MKYLDTISLISPKSLNFAAGSHAPAESKKKPNYLWDGEEEGPNKPA